MQFDDGRRAGAFYPFCEYSPEWQAIETARAENIPAAFIDLPWAELAREHGQPAHRYADGEERQSSYFEALMRRLGLEDYDDLWDQWFEVDAGLTLDRYLSDFNRLLFYARQTNARKRPGPPARKALHGFRNQEGGSPARNSGPGGDRWFSQRSTVPPLPWIAASRARPRWRGYSGPSRSRRAASGRKGHRAHALLLCKARFAPGLRSRNAKSRVLPPCLDVDGAAGWSAVCIAIC